MGAGKTTVGRHLADLLDRPFLDTDHEIERRTGASIAWIFEKEGEVGFRAREKYMIAELTCRKDIVLATGGGAVLMAENRNTLHRTGVVVYLYAPVELQLLRTARDRNRPLLHVQNPKQRLHDLFAVRDPLYRQTAHLIVQTHQGSARDLAQHILSLVSCLPSYPHSPSIL